MGMVSYAQNFEDVLLERAFKEIEAGFYLDIGACSPQEHSVTLHFYQKGWRGINVDPNPQYLKELKEQRTEDINLGLAISNQAGSVTFNAVENTGLSSLENEVIDLAQENGFASTQIEVEARTLEQLWLEHVPEGQEVHFLKIDVEGHEKQVIEGANWQTHRPWVVIAEATLPLSSTQNHQKWEPILLENGYQFAWFDGLNRFYVADEKQELLKAFTLPPNVFDEFRPAIALEHEKALQALANAAQTQKKLSEQIRNLDNLRISQANQNNALSNQNNALSNQNNALSNQNNALSVTQQNLEKTHQHLSQELQLAHQREQSGFASKEKLKRKHQALSEAFSNLKTTHEELRRVFRTRARPWWDMLLVKTSGKPRGLFRKFLFQKDGQPKPKFHSWIMKREDLPRSTFYLWMHSSEFQPLSKATSVEREEAIHASKEEQKPDSHQDSVS